MAASAAFESLYFPAVAVRLDDGQHHDVVALRAWFYAAARAVERLN